MKNTMIKLLKEVPQDYEGDVVLCSLSWCEIKQQRQCEHAGERYEQLLNQMCCTYENKKFNREEDEIKQEEGCCNNKNGEKDFSSKFKPHVQSITTGDYYGMLGLGTVRWEATDDDIKKAYKKMCLIYHPDKNNGDDSRIKQIIEAYNILSNPEKRRQYDSSDNTDDKLPQDRQYEENEFYTIFGIYFKKNAKWSINKNVPDFGDETSSDEDVNKFYTFWYSFKSWRDPPLDEMYNIEEATCREERRWMMKENEKKSQKKRKEEGLRIRKLVDMAYKRDFRIIKKKMREKEEKQRKKRELEEKRKLIEIQKEQERLKIEEERRILEIEEQKKNELLTQERKEKKSRLLNLFNLEKENEHFKCGIKNVIVQMEDDELNTISSLQEQSAIEFLRHKTMQYLEKKEKEREHQLHRNVLEEWSSNDIELFKKGCKKFPVGTEGRYRRIATYMKTKNESQVIEYAKALNAKMHTNIQQKKNNNNVLDWSKEQQIQLQNGIKQLNGYKEQDKWDKIAQMVEGKTKEQCIERVQYLKQLALQKKSMK
ncbi:hypothetical protein ENUP19_0302G0005 [Entamoeba nuttalli]|uniref:DnaJ domain containing protein n=1 Tax=Entamoeba nuttalli TaxID=412467 RepID=A0ABQ0DV05_9EUKA